MTTLDPSPPPESGSSAADVVDRAKAMLRSPRRYRPLLSEGDALALAKAYPSKEAACGEIHGLARARALLGCFPNGRADDPETYVAAVAKTLAGYSAPVVDAVTDPRGKLVREVRYLPAVADVVSVCEDCARDRATLAKLAQDHLRLRRDPAYRDRMSSVVGYRIGVRPE